MSTPEWTEEARKRLEMDATDIVRSTRADVQAALAELDRLTKRVEDLLSGLGEANARWQAATKRADDAEAKLAEAQKLLDGKWAAELRDVGLADQLAAAREEIETLRMHYEVAREREEAGRERERKLREALAALHAAVRTEKNPATSDAAEQAVAALRDSSEVKPALPLGHEFKDYIDYESTSRCLRCGQPESAHKPADPEVKPEPADMPRKPDGRPRFLR